jgi:hypothetical protein
MGGSEGGAGDIGDSALVDCGRCCAEPVDSGLLKPCRKSSIELGLVGPWLEFGGSGRKPGGIWFGDGDVGVDPLRR